MNSPCVLLDVDNTVLDFSTAEERALKRVFQEAGITADDAIIEHFRRINNDCWQQLEKGKITRQQVLYGRFERLFLEEGIKEVDVVPVQDRYENYLTERHFFMPGAEEVLEILHGKYRLFTVSNGNAVTQAKRIASARLQRWFEGFFVSETIGVEKPSSAFFDACFSQIPGIERKYTIIVGDSLTSDIQGGINVGIPTVWFNYGKSKPLADIRPDYIIHTLRELPTLLEKHFKEIKEEKNGEK